MPNTKNRANLKPNADRTPEQLKAMGAKGGRASGETRKKRKAAKDLAKMVLGLNVTTTAKTKKALKRLGYDVDAEGAPSVELMMQIAIANQAISGDLASAKFLYDYAQVPDIHVALERERMKAQADARSKVDLTVTGEADCLTEIRQRMLADPPKESLPPMGKVDFPENACIVPGKTDEVPDANEKEQETGTQEQEMPETASPIPQSES